MRIEMHQSQTATVTDGSAWLDLTVKSQNVREVIGQLQAKKYVEIPKEKVQLLH